MAKILGVTVKAATARLLDPLGQALLRAGISPNMVTWIGTAGVVAGSVFLTAQGRFVAAVVVITLCGLTDVMDGAMARARGTSSRYGALLDSTMDRVADGAIFSALIWWFAFHEGDRWTVLATMICLVSGQVVSYVKARAEGLGMSCQVGLVERAERLIIVGVGALVTGFGADWGLPAALWIVAVGSIFTVGQRMVHVARQERA
ncbi:MAG TPA: CDP-alcohol phosphatidyltransferase [Micromonosporaceae bacterium]|nr:CDP-alcohol phosphatidyltransferase [Micromonosporaceae bacterium]